MTDDITTLTNAVSQIPVPQLPKEMNSWGDVGRFIKSKFKGWKTVLMNLGLAFIPAAQVADQIFNLQEFKNILPTNWLPWYALGVVILNLIIRHYTDTAVGYKASA